MWEPSDWIALAAVVVAGVSVAYTWWDRRGARADSYRAALYDRQLAATDEFVQMARVAHERLLAGEVDALVEAVERMGDFIVTSGFLPPEVTDAGSEWLGSLGALGDPPTDAADEGEEAPIEAPAVTEAELDKVWGRFILRVRRETGVAGMHEQVRELTGAKAAARAQRDRVTRGRIEVLARRRYQGASDEELRREGKDGPPAGTP